MSRRPIFEEKSAKYGDTAPRDDNTRERWEKLRERWSPSIQELYVENASIAEKPTSLYASIEELHWAIVGSGGLGWGLARHEMVRHRSAKDANFQLAAIFSISGYWDELRLAPDLYDYFRHILLNCLLGLTQDLRIRTLSTALARIADLHSGGRTVLTSSQIGELTAVIVEAFSTAGFFEEASSIDATRSANPRGWTHGKWREENQNETAADYFTKAIAPLPYSMRPTTTALAAAQPELYKALAAHCSNLKRGRRREGAEEVNRAHYVSDLLPIGAPKVKDRKPR